SVFPQGLLEEPDWSMQSPPLVMCPPPPWSLRGSSTWPTKPPGLTAASRASPPSPASCAVPPLQDAPATLSICETPAAPHTQVTAHVLGGLTGDFGHGSTSTAVRSFTW
ncbi:hypothetical protein H1C71_042634, partial [Ictidomys tridecemlineatus]